MMDWRIISGRSLPSRERGLKLAGDDANTYGIESLPSRERGLKFYNGLHLVTGTVVAPLAGAWIEITIIRAIHTEQ